MSIMYWKAQHLVRARKQRFKWMKCNGCGINLEIPVSTNPKPPYPLCDKCVRKPDFQTVECE